MPIEVLTGLPRNGKTLLLVSKLVKAAKENKRPVFQCGIDGLVPGLATPLDATKWNAKNADGSYVVPDGSLVFVDEAWKWFGHLRDARGQQTPPHVLDMAEHGHRGLDFIFTTQGPGQLYPFLRTLIQGHTHVVRVMGAEMAKLYEWPELNDDVKSASMREAAINTFWKYPKDLYTFYKSASVHTVKFKLNRRVVVFAGVVVAVVALVYSGVTSFAPASDAVAKIAPGKGSASGQPASRLPPGVVPPVPTPQAQQAYREGYAYQNSPRIPGMAWTAPIFDGRPVQADPHTYCMATGKGGQDGCHCYTEQATPIAGVDLDACMAMALYGEPYNPHKPPLEVAQAAKGEGAAPVTDDLPGGKTDGTAIATVEGSAAGLSSAAGTGTVEQVASYGGFRQ